MAEQDRARRTAGPAGEGLASGEQEQLVYALEVRFATHLDTAAAAVREAERELTEAQVRLARAKEAAAHERYTSSPLPFMRESLSEEVEGLARKTTPKKVRASYRFLLDRAAELAAAEVQGFQDDQAQLTRERTDGIDACHAAVEHATAALVATREMQERVRAAERAARKGLEVMVAKLSSEG
ncbi:hypothetical protein [Ornithinimicrobium pratense]|uniref:Uncharacterized protein n=1 Tax=Ornithinimicrobium pratense TaxID=2593973 RepID=A0A5J6V9U1_9MICO|nr:hypothetical protein [Ornithinimicrobium pratense]QFG69981.1 hypothetical protein FY030_15830 [Ornithinimicrobium pratense]